MDGRVWAQYLREVLGESIEKPFVVLMDNFECHVSAASYKIMNEELGTHLCPLPANSTSVCKPLDVGVMAPVKRNLRNLCLLEEQIIGDDEDPYSLTAQQKRMAMVQRAISAWDMLTVSSPTGTGKTLAYLIPLVAHVMEHRLDVEEHRILGLVVAPVRELCVQLETQAKVCVRISKMKTALLIGGIPVPTQLHRLKKGVQVVVATPGRLYELVTGFTLDLSHVITCVLDEADLLVDQSSGFEAKVLAILAALPPTTQLVLVSATVTQAVLSFAHAHLHEAIRITIASAATSSFQDSTTRQVAQRLSILQSFVDGVAPVLVSTGLLGRGMNLLSVDDVVVFDMPSTIEVGRAGRRRPGSDAATAGTATIYVGADSAALFPDLLALLRATDAVIPDEIKHESIRERTRAMHKRQHQALDASKRAFHATRQMSSAQHQARWQQWAIDHPKRKTIVVDASAQHKKFKFIAMS
ncbi:hypothetical protein DYB38_006651 [Aphanomyces astaci]|uniref:Uncharacterized protein n=2 Tax=Aphanomyces astaci TaxID=112090 RepID=A0A397CY31_APHAT|nr:hypothetical protein DYB38_006651 [Aphanomyces astaci]RHZ40568.1 hypothetical protein DYB31_004603 [Aphanomyces astaci]